MLQRSSRASEVKAGACVGDEGSGRAGGSRHNQPGTWLGCPGGVAGLPRGCVAPALDATAAHLSHVRAAGHLSMACSAYLKCTGGGGRGARSCWTDLARSCWTDRARSCWTDRARSCWTDLLSASISRQEVAAGRLGVHAGPHTHSMQLQSIRAQRPPGGWAGGEGPGCQRPCQTSLMGTGRSPGVSDHLPNRPGGQHDRC